MSCGGHSAEPAPAVEQDGHFAHGFGMGQLVGKADVSYLRYAVLLADSLETITVVRTPARKMAAFLRSDTFAKWSGGKHMQLGLRALPQQRKSDESHRNMLSFSVQERIRSTNQA